MGMKEIAKEALEIINGRTTFSKPGAKMALTGYFEGVVSGTITVGQSWLAELIIESSWKESEQAVLKKVFSSGMCCHGQELDSEKVRSFTAREGR